MSARATFPDHEVPYFAWDQALTAGELRAALKRCGDRTWLRLAAWILREARPGEVWAFLDPRQVRDRLPALRPLLGRRRAFWEYLIGAWRELGKL
jgi:hypothetical protein